MLCDLRPLAYATSMICDLRSLAYATRKYAAGKKAAAYYARAALSELTDTVGRGNPRQLSILAERNAAALHCMEQSSCAQHCAQRRSLQADYVGRGRARQHSSTVGRQADALLEQI